MKKVLLTLLVAICFFATIGCAKVTITVTGDKEVAVGETITLVATASVSDQVQWTSANPEVATVADGVVTGVKAGTTVITAKVKDVEAKTTITVKESSTTVVISGELHVVIGKTSQLTAQVSPSTANQTVTWTSSNETIATVSNAGLVSALATGSVKITATNAYGKSAEATVLVFDVPTSVEISGGKQIEVEETLQISVDVTPDTANQLVEWSSSDPTVATIDSSGLVTALKPGTTTITATADEGVSASYQLTVAPKTPLPTQVNVTADEDEILIDDELQLTAVVDPTGAKQEVTWSSSNQAIATVDQNGLVKALAAGTVTITAKAINNVEGTYELTVLEAPKNLTVAELKAALADLFALYAASKQVDIKATISGTQITTFTESLKYVLDNDTVTKLAWIQSALSADTPESSIHINNGRAYLAYDDVKGYQALTANDHLVYINEYSANKLIASYLPYATEEAFYQALSFTSLDGDKMIYSLSVADYAGDVLELVGIDSVSLQVKLVDGNITEVALISVSADTTESIVVSFNGTANVNITLPDLTTYPAL